MEHLPLHHALKDVVRIMLVSRELVAQLDAQLDRTLLVSVHLDPVELGTATQKQHAAKNQSNFQCAQTE